MSQSRTDAIGVLRWGLRRYLGTFLAVGFGVAVLLPLLLLTRPATFDAEVLVVAQRLDLGLVALPRYGEAIFDDGEVARRVAVQFGDGGDLEDVVPDRVSLLAEQDSVVMHVIGHDSDPVTAAAIANLAAEVFTASMNAPGEGVGAFAVQSRAVPPVESVEVIPALPYTVGIGLFGGIVLGLAVVSSILIARRPVVHVGDAASLTGFPVVGTVVVPRAGRGYEPSVEEIGGLVAVCRRLIALRAPAIRVVSTPDGEDQRRHLTTALLEIARLGTSDARQNGSSRPSLVLVDPAHPLEAVWLPDVVTVLVVTEGTSAAALEAAVIEHLDDGGPAGLIMVRYGPRRSAREKGAVPPPADPVVVSGQPVRPSPPAHRPR